MQERQLILDFERPPARKQLAMLNPDDIYVHASSDMLPLLSEDSRIERKSANIHRDPLATYYSMWANTSPEGGIIVLGVDDDGAIQGCSGIPPQQLNWHEKVGRELCPDARYDTKRVECVRDDGQRDFVLLIRVYYREDKVVETNKGDAYIRRGDSRYRLSEAEKRELAIDKGEVSFEQEPCKPQYPDDFDMAAIREFAVRVKELKGLRTEYTPEQVLCNRHLGKLVQGDFVPNIACALLFANDPATEIPGCVVRLQRYEGKEKLTGEGRNVVKDYWIEGRVPQVIQKTDEILQSQIRTFSRLGPGGKFVTAPEYPQAAWYEAVVNACVHRSYSLRNMNIFIKIFDDRLEIESPGPFLPFVTPENIYDVHHRRNYFLMDAMFYMDFVKCENEGTRRMRDVMLAMDLPAPEFEQKDVGNAIVRVTLRNNQSMRQVWIDKDATEIVGEAMSKLLEKNEIRCLNFVAEHGKINVNQAQRLLGEKTWHAARKVLMGLEEKGVLEHVSKYTRDPNSHYRLAKKLK